jgi:hypothetical protein
MLPSQRKGAAPAGSTVRRRTSDQNNAAGRIAGRGGAKSRLRCGSQSRPRRRQAAVVPISNARLKARTPDSRRIRLDVVRHNAYRRLTAEEGTAGASFPGFIAGSRSTAHRRGRMIRPRDAAVRDTGAF